MLEILLASFTSEKFVQLGLCYLGKSFALEIQIISNILIAIAYYSVFVTIVYSVVKHQNFAFKGIFLLFAAFSVTCGTSHLIEVWNFWHLSSWLNDRIEAIVALVSVLTSINLSFLIPKALSCPSPAQLEATNRELQREIGDRQQVEKALQESEQLLANLTKVAPVGIFRTDVRGNWVYGNDRSFKIIGLSQAESMSLGWTKTLHPEDRDRVIRTWFNFVKRGIPFYCECRFQQPDGKVVWVLGEAIAQKDADGNTIGYIGTVTDITERKQAENLLADYNQTLEIQVHERTAELEREIADRKQIEIQLRHSQAKLSAILNNVGAYIYIKDLYGNYIYVNRLTVELFDLPETEIIGANDFKFFSHETALRFQESDKKAIESGITHRFDEVGVDRKGKLYYFWATKVPLKAEDGSIYGICGISTDITELKQVEEALRQSKQQMQALLSAMPDLMFRQKIDGTYLDVTGNTSSLIGLYEALIGADLKDTPILEQIKADLLERFQSAVKTGELQIYEHDIQKPDGIQSFEARIIKSGADEVVCIVRDITERKRFIAALQESEERYRLVVTTMAEGIVLQDANGVIRTCNASAKKILGLSRKQMMGRTPIDPNWQAIREDGSPFPSEEHPAMVTLRTGKPCSNLVMGVKKPDGSLTWISINSQPLFRAGETLPYAVVTSFSDITDRKQAEKALRESEARFQAFMDNSPAAAWITDEWGRIVYLSQTYSRIFKLPSNYAVGKTDLTIYPADFRSEYLKNIRKVVETNRALEAIEPAPRLDGSIGEFLVYKFPLPSASGQTMVGGVAIDITERKQAEEALRQSEARYLAIIEDQTELICRFLPDGTFTFANEAFCRFFGHQREEIVGDRYEVNIYEEDREDVVNLINSISLENPVITMENRSIARGELRWTQWIDRGIFDERGNLVEFQAVGRDITDRKQIENALKESEERLQLALEGSGDGLWDWNVQTGKLYLSPRYQEMLGYKPGELNLDLAAWVEMIHPDDLQMAKDILAAHFQDGSFIYAFDYRFRTKSGEWKWIADYGKVVARDENGKPLRMVGTHRDVNDRKQAEEAMRSSQHFLQKVADATPHILYLFDIKQIKTIYLNRQSDAILGYSAEEICNSDPEWFINCFHPDDRHLCYELQQRFEHLSDNEVISTEYRFKHKNGEWRWLNTREVVFARDSNGRPSQVLGSVEDITGRKQIEEALQESNERFQLAASAVKGIIYDWDLKQNTSKRSQRLLDIIGYRSEEVDSNAKWWDEHIHPEDWPDVCQRISQAFATQNHYVLEYRIRHRDGRYIYLSDYGIIVRDASGQAVRAVGNAIDVSDARQAELALQKALVAAEAASIAKSQFLSNMSHELRTPLNAILGFSQMLARSNSLSHEQKEQLKIINRSGEHLLNLINDILSMSKIEAGQITFNEKNFDLYQLLDELEKMFGLKATSNRLKLIFERSPDIPQHIQTDENKLRQVLINLLGNAIKFTKFGSVTLRVRAKAGACSMLDRSNNLEPIEGENKCDLDITSETPSPTLCLCFEIEDTGPGIAPDEIDTLFDPFVQTETGRRSMQGTGLGLPISQQFVQLMGGKIAVSSQLGKGTIFTFNILIKQTNESDEKSLSDRRQVIGLAPQQPEYRILVVEDVEESRLLLVKLLETVGFQVRAAVNGVEAVKLWSSWKPHLVWMDMRMAVMDGYEATKQIKARQKQLEAGDWGLKMIRDRLRKQRMFEDEANNIPDSSVFSSPLQPMQFDRVTPKSDNSSERSPTTKTIIIALTASAFEQDRANIMAAGCDDFIRKPFQESVLFDKMAQHLGVRYVYEQNSQPNSSEPVTPMKLAAEDLRVMPIEWIARLHQAVICADEERIFQLTKEIPDSEGFLATKIGDLVNNFRLDMLLDLTEELTNE